VVRVERQETPEIGRVSVRLYQPPKAVRRVATPLVRKRETLWVDRDSVCRTGSSEKPRPPYGLG
jgi:hypothetical protein